ncbi:unnamed protein product [Brassica oleracea]
MLSKGDNPLRSLYDLLKKEARTMTRLERLSIGIAIITEGVIIAENSSSLIPEGRLLAYKNYDSLSKFCAAINLWAMSSVSMLGKTLGKPYQETSSSDPLCLHWDSTRAPTITEVLEVEKKNNEKTQDEEKQQVETDVEFSDGDKERETSKINEKKNNKRKLIHKLRSPCKLKGRNEEEEIRNKSIRRMKRKEKMKRLRKLRRNFKMKMVPDSYESPCNYDDTKGAPNDENEEEENSGGKRNATDDENDDEEISDTQQLTEVNILGENENTEKSLRTKTLKKMKKKDA